MLVGVIDEGIDHMHPDLLNRVNVGLSRNFADEYSLALSSNAIHGTHVAGIIGAECNNQIGIAGVCWNVQLVSLRVIDSDGALNSSGLIQAIEYSDYVGISILNIALRVQSQDEYLP